MDTTEDSPLVPLSLLTMVLATAERLLGVTDLQVQIRPADPHLPQLRVALASAANPANALIATLHGGVAGFDVTFARSGSSATAPSALAWSQPAAGRGDTAPMLRVREVRRAARRRAADLAFAAFDFRPHAVVDVGTWRFDTSDHTWTRTVVLRDSILPEQLGVDATFMVHFKDRTATVEEASILSRHLSAPDYPSAMLPR